MLALAFPDWFTQVGDYKFTGLILGYAAARLVKMDEASGIAVEMGRIASMGIASAAFGPIMNINGSIQASFWRKSANTVTR